MLQLTNQSFCAILKFEHEKEDGHSNGLSLGIFFYPTRHEREDGYKNGAILKFE